MASDINFFKEQNQKALRETKKTNKQKGEILISPFRGSLFLHFIQFGQ